MTRITSIPRDVAAVDAMARRRITSAPTERVAEEEVWTSFPIEKKPKVTRVLVAVDEMMKSISIEKKPKGKSVMVDRKERMRIVPIEKKPKAISLKGLGKPNTPQEPCNDELCEQQNKAKVLRYSEHVLRDYNKKHETHLMLLNLLKYKIHHIYCAHTVDFKNLYRKWIHINLEARRPHSEKPPLLLFAELYIDDDEPFLTRLSLLPPLDNLHGKQNSPCSVRLPLHRFRAGFVGSCPVSEGEVAGTEVTSLAENTLLDYNKKNGTRLEFVRAAKCHRFSGTGLSMDFKEKKTIWKHMNFFAKRPKHDECADCYEELLLFAELYVGDKNKNVLATLSVVGPQDKGAGCIICPASIQHPGCFH